MNDQPKSPATLRSAIADAHIADRIREARHAAGLTLTDLGTALGITYQQVQKYETHEVRVPAGRLWQIAKILNVPLAFFFEGMGEEHLRSTDQAGWQALREMRLGPRHKNIVRGFMTLNPENRELIAKAIARLIKQQQGAS